MQLKNIFTRLLNVNGIVVDNVRFNPIEQDSIIFSVHIRKSLRLRDPRTGKKATFYDYGNGQPSYWRSLDFGPFKVYIEYMAARVICKDGRVLEEKLPWAPQGSRFTYDFEQLCCFLLETSSKKAVSEFLSISWNSVGPIAARYVKRNGKSKEERYRNLRRFGIDETSYKKGYKYLTTVVDQDTHKVIWCHVGHGKKVFEKFLMELTEEQRNNITCVSGDGARWITDCVNEYLPNAKRCVDPFHVIEWTNEALDKVRTEAWNEARRNATPKPKRGKGRPKKGEEPEEDVASKIKGSQYALGKNPENLTENQKNRLEFIAMSNPRLYRAYLLKEKLRLIFRDKNPDTVRLELKSWMNWAQRCRIPVFRELREKIKRHFNNIVATIEEGLSNARIEAINNKIKLSIRMAYGFRNDDSMLSMIMLRCSGLEVFKPTVSS